MTEEPKLTKMLLIVWPLLAGILMIMTGNGLQGTLLGLRASFEGFSPSVTGFIMSLYYLGFVVGCLLVPKMITSVGHIRVFAALASVASTTILLHGVFINPWTWAAIRIVSGASFAGLFIVCESWMNNIAPNKLRAQIFGAYLCVIHLGLFSGQFLINLAEISGLNLFILISILVSVSLVPVTLANKPAPGYEEPELLPFKKLVSKSQLAILGVFVAGMCGGAILGLGSVYATKIGMGTSGVAIFIAAFVLGAAIIPLVMGWISDRIDRRKAIIAMGATLTFAAVMINLTGFMTTFIFIFGGAVSSLYSICIAYMNDQIKQSQIMSATTSLIFINGVGACLGPLILGVFMDYIGVVSFFVMLALAGSFVVFFGVFRAFVGDPVDVEDQGDFMPIPTRSSPAVMEIGEED